MKVYIRSYRIPTVLIIMGGIMTIMASSTLADNYEVWLFIYGTVCLLLGIFGWLGVQIPKALRGMFRSRSRGGAAANNKRR
jgi:hypothetical protein